MQDFSNLSEAIVFVEVRGNFQPSEIQTFGPVCDQMNEAKHSDLLHQGFQVSTPVHCFFRGNWYLGVVKAVNGDAKEARYHVEWSFTRSSSDTSGGMYWFSPEHLSRHIVQETCLGS